MTQAVSRPEAETSPGSPDYAVVDDVHQALVPALWADELVGAAVTTRPVDEAAQLLALLSSQHVSAAEMALLTAASDRNVPDLVELWHSLRQSQTAGAAEILRAAVLVKPVADVAQLLALVASVGGDEVQEALRSVALSRPVSEVVELACLLVAGSGSATGDRWTPSPQTVSIASPSTTTQVEDGTLLGERTEPIETALSARLTVLRGPRSSFRRVLQTVTGGVLIVVAALCLPMALVGWSITPRQNSLVLLCSGGFCLLALLLIVRKSSGPLLWGLCAAWSGITLALGLSARNGLFALNGAASDWLSGGFGNGLLCAQCVAIGTAIVRFLPIGRHTQPARSQARPLKSI